MGAALDSLIARTASRMSRQLPPVPRMMRSFMEPKILSDGKDCQPQRLPALRPTRREGAVPGRDGATSRRRATEVVAENDYPGGQQQTLGPSRCLLRRVVALALLD